MIAQKATKHAGIQVEAAAGAVADHEADALAAVEIRDIVGARRRRHAERQYGGEKQVSDRMADDRRAAEQRDELAPFQLIELHPLLHSQWPDCRI
jgi:hypothetical protein